MTVVLSPEEMFQVQMVARARHDPKRARNVLDRKIDARRSSREIEFAGTMGEAAVAKVLGVPLHLFVGLAGDKREGDLTFRGLSVQVKHRFYRRGYLIVSDLDKFKADVAVMTCPGALSNEVDVVGWISRDDFLRRMERRDFGYGMHYCVPSEKLRPIQELLTGSGAGVRG